MNHRGREGERENEGAVAVAVHSEAQIRLDGGRSEAASGNCRGRETETKKPARKGVNLA